MLETLEKTETKNGKTAKVSHADPEIFKKISQLIASSEIDQKTLAKRVGYSAATISTYLGNGYEGDLTKLESAFAKYLSHTKIAKDYTRVNLEFEETSIAQRVFTAAKMCQLNGEIGICIGASGLGKTTAIKQYALESTGVIFVDPNEETTPRALMRQIGEQLKVSEGGLMPRNYIGEITKRLNDSGYLVIVDESENIKMACFRMLRKIHDRCNFSFGLLFVGTEKLYENLHRLRGEFSYITNRIGYVEKLDALKTSDVELLVKQVFPNCTSENIKTFESITNQNARVLFNTIKRTNDLLANGKVELCHKTISAARNMLLH